ncbi:MAG: hypothetical protein ACRDKJ_08490 [Actinomycetota bacterium]
MRRAVAGSIAFAALFTAVSAAAQEAMVPEIEDVPAPIVRLLDDYGRAFETKDRALLDGTLGPLLKVTALRAFDNAKDVPFERVTITAKTQYSGNLAYRRVRARYPGKQVRTYQVTEASTLDIETVAYEEDGAFTFVRDSAQPNDRYDGWRLESTSDLDLIGFFSPYHLWDTGPVTVLRSDHFVLLTHPEVAEEMRPVLAVAERAYAKATEWWPRRVTERYAIIVPATTEELGALFHATIDLEKFVAFVAAGADQAQGWRPTGPRMFVHLSHLRNYDEGGQLEILAHELLHAITRPISGPNIPVWIEEGLANAGGGRGARPSLAGQGDPPADFPTDEQFVKGAVRQIMIRYDQAQVAVETLIGTFDREALARFYERLGSARSVPGTDEYHVRRAVQDALDWTEADWLAAWRARLG